MVNLKFTSEAAIYNYLSFGTYNASENILKILRFLLSTFLRPPNSHVYIYSDKILPLWSTPPCCSRFLNSFLYYYHYSFLQMVRTKAWYFIPFITGGGVRKADPSDSTSPLSSITTMVVLEQFGHGHCISIVEIFGFSARVVNAHQTQNWPYPRFDCWVNDSMGILLAPALFSAFIYMSFGCIILLVDGEAYSIVWKNWVIKYFVGGYVLWSCFKIGMSTPPHIWEGTGEHG